MKHFLFLVIVASILNSCAYHFGTISSAVVEKNVVYEDIAYGVSQTDKLYSIGGIPKDALIMEAKMNLVKNRPLKANEAYLNYTVDFKHTFLFMFQRTKVTMSADVVRISDKAVLDPYSENYKDKINQTKHNNDLFAIGDSIMDGNLLLGQVISIQKNDNIRISYLNEKDNFRTSILKSKKLYSKCNSFNNFSPGDTINYYFEGVANRIGIIKALGKKDLIIKNKLGSFEKINYEDILQEKK